MRRLASIQELTHLPWVMGGDFNEILLLSEKMGGISRSFEHMNAFSEALNDCGLSDLSCIGDPFTWSNKRSGSDRILARLERFLSNAAWHEVFPDAVVENLCFMGSDHRSILLKLSTVLIKRCFGNPKRFIFEHKWMIEEDFSAFFKHGWENLSGYGNLPEKLQRCSGVLKEWAGFRFNKLGKKINLLRLERDKLLSYRNMVDSSTQIKNLELQD